MKVAILGSAGMLGSDLVVAFKDCETYCFDIQTLDITNQESLKKIEKIKPSVVINAAAYTDVDKAETDKENVFKINAHAVKDLARICKKINSVLVHYSTDYVFDGKKKSYKEDDKKKPISVYGASKAQGEDFIMDEMENFYIIRSSWLFGKNGKNFVKAVINMAKEKDAIDVVDDQFGSPTYTKDLALKTKEIIKKEYGIYHVTNDGICSWFKFAKEIIKQKGLNTKVNPITSKELTRAAKRPQYSVLQNTKNNSLRHWKLALKDYLR